MSAISLIVSVLAKAWEGEPGEKGPTLPRRLPPGLWLWARRAGLMVAFLIVLAWSVCAVAFGIALYNSPLGCPATMGCEGLKRTECSPASGLLWHSGDHEPCEN